MRFLRLLAASLVATFCLTMDFDGVEPLHAVAPVCQQDGTRVGGGACAVGDTGPGGGTVFYSAGSMQSWGQFLEVAPNTWSGGTADPSIVYCSPQRSTGMSGRGIGDGRQNTIDGTGCNAPDMVMAYRGGGKSDWYIPAEQELYALRTWQQSVTPFQGGFDTSPWPNYFTSSRWNANNVYFTYLSTDLRTNLTWAQWNAMYVRPIRAIGKFGQTVSWSPTLTVPVAGSPHTPSALASSDGAGAISYSLVSAGTTGCSINSSTAVVTFTAVGTCTVRATAASTSTLLSGSKDVSFTVALGTQVVSWNPSTAIEVASSPATPSSLATTTGNGAITYSVVNAGTTACSVNSSTAVVTFTSVGTCTVRATAAATSQFSSATSDVAFQIQLAAQSVSWSPTTSLSTTSSPVVPSAAASSSGPGSISYAVFNSGTTGCSVNSSSGQLTFTGAGSCVVRATAAATATHAASTKDVTFVITAPATTTTTSPPTTTAPVTTTSEVAPTTTVSFGQTQIARVATTTTVSRTTQATVATTSTTTTTVARPVATTAAPTTTTTVPEIAEAAPGEAAILVDGEAVESTVARRNDQLVIAAGDMSATISGVTADGAVSPLDNDGNIRLSDGDQIQVEASGFAPNSDVEVWLFSTPTLLGTVTVNSEGAASAKFALPAGAENGNHRVALNGKNVAGEDASFAVGIVIGSSSGGVSTAGKVLIAIPIALAVLFALVIPARRRRKVQLLD
jgi:hypothetical protein